MVIFLFDLKMAVLRKFVLIRIHMEEDAGKNIHADASNESFVDLNRAGTPLLEIVSHPDISSTYEAKAYLKTLRYIVHYLGICSGNMEEGAFRADTNISFAKKVQEYGTSVNLKILIHLNLLAMLLNMKLSAKLNLLNLVTTCKTRNTLMGY